MCGFRHLPWRGRGSHSYWEHPADPTARINLAGADGTDAKPYEDDAYLVRVPELPGPLAHGATHEEAVATGEAAIATWLAGLRHFGHLVPPPRLAAAGVP